MSNFLSAPVISHTRLSSSFYEIVCHHDQVLDFIPGQYLIVKIHDSRVSQYSLVSSPHQNQFTLLVDTTPAGDSSTYFQNLRVGDSLEFLPPMGKFSLQSDDSTHVLFMATGSGIAPFISMLNQLKLSSDPRPAYLLFGLRYYEDIFYADLLNQIKSNYHFNYLISLSNPSELHPYSGYIQTHLASINFPWSNTSVYLCGSPTMIQDSQALLLELGVKPEYIYYEKFW